jgi:hypothetical protein
MPSRINGKRWCAVRGGTSKKPSHTRTQKRARVHTHTPHPHAHTHTMSSARVHMEDQGVCVCVRVRLLRRLPQHGQASSLFVGVGRKEIAIVSRRTHN